jgi:hypothetical protein
MRRRSIVLSHAPALIISAIVLVGLAWWWNRPVPVRGPDIFAAGAKWALQDVSWAEYDGHWRVSVSGFLLRTARKRIPPDEVLKGLCGSILVSLPSAPNGVERDDVYRVTFNSISYIGRNKEKNSFWRGTIPVQILDGSCQLKKRTNLYYLTYPGPLQNWELKDARITKNSEGQGGKRLKIYFVKQTKEGAALPFLEACEAFVADPGHLPALLGLDELSEVVEIEVNDSTQTGPDLLYFRRSVGVAFGYLNDKCIPLEKGQKA